MAVGNVQAAVSRAITRGRPTVSQPLDFEILIGTQGIYTPLREIPGIFHLPEDNAG